MAKIFVSHSSHDKSAVVQPLVEELKKNNHQVWYDTESLRIGDSLSLAISDGLSQSQYFVVVLSTMFLRSNWCMRELGAIVGETISKQKRVILIRVDSAEVPAIISDIVRIDLSSTGAELVTAIARVKDHLAGRTGQSGGAAKPPSPEDLVNVLIEADRTQTFNFDLIRSAQPQNADGPENEGLILIKPGGTFYLPCLLELLGRVSAHCRIRQIRLLDGNSVRKRGLFDQQYITSTKIAMGEIPLTEEDLAKVRSIYGAPEFEAAFGTAYSDDLVVPALQLCDGPDALDPVKLSHLWERGREEGLFHNRRWDGLNKIGYQKSVFPIPVPTLPNPNVRIVLNGFIPGYRNLFMLPSARTVALHVSTREPWQNIRDKVVGGDSDPFTCQPGSIRRDAADEKIPLDPQDSVVNGQRNICHSSATLFDGMRELMVWFEYDFDQTLLGRLCLLNQVQPGQLETLTDRTLADISVVTRNESLAQLLVDVRLRVAKDELRGAFSQLPQRIQVYAHKIGVKPASLVHERSVMGVVGNGLRLALAGEDLYLRAIGTLFEDTRDYSQFLEVARAIRFLAGRDCSDEVLAEAYRIAAGDLLFSKCPAFSSDADSPELARALIFGELPEESLNCALRTQQNVIRDLGAVFGQGDNRAGVTTMGDSTDWSDFLANLKERHSSSQPVAAIILCGGRSTRMRSTIPKPVLPFRRKLMFNVVSESISKGLGGSVEIFAAVGFRESIVRRAIGSKAKYLAYEKTLGLGFRVATCLETIAEHEGVVLIAYTDMPLVSSSTIAQLVNCVKDRRTFALVQSHTDELSGHIIEANGRIERIIQQRLNPSLTSPRMASLHNSCC